MNPLLQPEELATSDYLLKIFRVSMPHMPKTAVKFGHELQGALQPMILKPSGGGTHVSFRNSRDIFSNLSNVVGSPRGRRLYVHCRAKPYARLCPTCEFNEIMQWFVPALENFAF